MKRNGVIKQLLLASSGYWVLNKALVQTLGLETAFFLSSLAEAEQTLGDEEGWFYQTIKTVEDITTLSRHKQETCIDQLKKLGILETAVRGLPPKRYFKLNYSKVAETIEIATVDKNAKNSQINMRNNRKTNCENSAPNKEHSNKELNNKYKNICSDKSEPIPYKEIIEYLNSKTGRQFNFKGQANRRLIKARFNEGFTEKDFYQVIDIKTNEWINTEMEKYLRPSTLFGNKFDGYLNQVPASTKKEEKPKEESKEEVDLKEYYSQFM